MLIAVIISFLFVAASHCYTEAFFTQRVHLEISRMLNYDLNRIIPLECLDSMRGAVFCQYFRWVMLIIMFYLYDWKIPVGFYVMELLYIIFRPLPKWSYQEVMSWFRVASNSDKYVSDLYIKTQNILRAKGINV